jgi:hypothetical protein
MSDTIRKRLTGSTLAAIFFAACAPANTMPGETTGGATPTQEEAREAADPLPIGRGSLHQDAFTLSLRDGDLLLKVTPLEESVIRLAAPDTYQRLRATADSRIEQARDAVYSGEPELMLVSFFSYSPDTDYRPDDLYVMYQGRALRPVVVIPVTSGWGRGRLQQREIQNAVYVFEPEIDYSQPMTVRYGALESTNWNTIVPTLDRERARVRGRTGG